MENLSNSRVKKKRYTKDLVSLFTVVNDHKLMEELLRSILTPSEFEEIGLRLQIFRLLHQGVTQREIAKKLKVSIGTISRGAKEYKYGQADFNKILSILDNE